MDASSRGNIPVLVVILAKFRDRVGDLEQRDNVSESIVITLLNCAYCGPSYPLVRLSTGRVDGVCTCLFEESLQNCNIPA